jgi:hypothetical protein
VGKPNAAPEIGHVEWRARTRLIAGLCPATPLSYIYSLTIPLLQEYHGMWLVPGGLTIVLNSFTPLSCSCSCSCSCSLDVTIPSISQLQEPAPCTRDIIKGQRIVSSHSPARLQRIIQPHTLPF